MHTEHFFTKLADKLGLNMIKLPCNFQVMGSKLGPFRAVLFFQKVKTGKNMLSTTLDKLCSLYKSKVFEYMGCQSICYNDSNYMHFSIFARVNRCMSSHPGYC